MICTPSVVLRTCHYTCIYIDCSNAKPIFYTYTLNLRDLVLLTQNLEEPGALLGVGDFLKLAYLYIPVLLDESNDGNGIVLDHGTIGRGEQGCIL